MDSFNPRILIDRVKLDVHFESPRHGGKRHSEHCLLLAAPCHEQFIKRSIDLVEANLNLAILKRARLSNLAVVPCQDRFSFL